MPTIFQQRAGDPVKILTDYLGQDDWGINPDTTSSTSFSFEDLTPPFTFGSMTVTGTGFYYGTIDGERVPIGGTIQSLKINPGFISQPPFVPLQITNLDLSVTQLLLSAQNGEAAVRELFVSKVWTWIGSSGNDSFTGGVGSDHLTGNDGNDTIFGGNGSDTLTGDNGMPEGDGNDSLYGEAGADILYGGGGSDYLSGGAHDDYASGGTGDDRLYGDSGNDRLYGQSGNDLIVGGTGADRMDGQAGNDIYYVDNAGDRVIEGVSEAGVDFGGVDHVYSSVSFGFTDTTQVTGAFENLTLQGSENLYGRGNALNNVIVGNSGNNSISGYEGNDTISGGLGADNMYGGDGNDSYYVDNVADKVDEYGTTGVDKVLSYITFNLSNSAQVSGPVENLTLLGSANINATGNSTANYITGNAGSNIINGGLGADTMAGGAGHDTYYVDNIGDKVIEANVTGIDKVNSSVSFSISGQFIEHLTLTGSANISGTGNSVANAITGNAGSNTLNGGLGNDTLYGGAGADRFVFNTALGNTNVDKITDFNVPQDAIWLDNAVFTALGANGLLSAAAFHIGTAAHDANDRIVYNSATGALFYDSNGSAAGGSVQFATLSKGLGMTNADFLII